LEAASVLMQAGTNAPAAQAAQLGAAEGDQPALKVLMKCLKVSEDDAKDLLALAAEQGRPASVEAAASIFYEERRHLLILLSYLLQVFLEYCPVPDPEVLQHATTLLRHLVSPEVTAAAESTLLARLCTITQVWPLIFSLDRVVPVRKLLYNCGEVWLMVAWFHHCVC
jgi:hypothetical protein